MRICVNGITRDMTPEEEAEYLRQSEESTIEDKAEAYDILMGEEESDLLSAAETLIAERTKEGTP